MQYEPTRLKVSARRRGRIGMSSVFAWVTGIDLWDWGLGVGGTGFWLKIVARAWGALSSISLSLTEE